MIRASRCIVAGVVLVAGLVAGCASSHVSGEKSAVVCDKCGMTVRKPYTVPSYEGNVQEGYFYSKTPECSSCQKAQADYAATGKFDPACATCGGTMKVAAK